MTFRPPRTPTLAVSLKQRRSTGKATPSSAPRRPKKTPTVASTSKNQKLTPGQLKEKEEAEVELVRQRAVAQDRLRTSWELIFEKYGKDFEGITDEIDPVTGDIVVDNGHLRGLEYISEEDEGDSNDDDSDEGETTGLEDVFRWGGITGPSKGSSKKRKLEDGEGRTPERSHKKKKTKKTHKEVDRCAYCQYQDELDDTLCQYCSTPARSVAEKGLDNNQDASKSLQLPLKEIEKSIPASLPMSDFITKKIGSHGVAVTKALERARNGGSSPLANTRPIGLSSSPPPILASSPLSRWESGIRVPTSKPGSALKKMASPAVFYIPDDEIDELSLPTPLPSAKGLLLHMSPFSRTTKNIQTPKKEKKQRVLRMVSVEIRIPRSVKSEIPNEIIETPVPANNHRKNASIGSNSTRRVSRNNKARVPAVSSSEKKIIEAPLVPKTDVSAPIKATATKESLGKENVIQSCLSPLARNSDTWAPPPPESDPFYNPLWADQHPDGTPTFFPPRPVDSMVTTPNLSKPEKSHKAADGLAKKVRANTHTNLEAEVAEKEATKTPSRKDGKVKAVAAPGRTRSEASKLLEESNVILLSVSENEDGDKTPVITNADSLLTTEEKRAITPSDDDDIPAVKSSRKVSLENPEDAPLHIQKDDQVSKSSPKIIPTTPLPSSHKVLDTSQMVKTPCSSPPKDIYEFIGNSSEDSSPLFLPGPSPPLSTPRKKRTPFKKPANLPTKTPTRVVTKTPRRAISMSPFVDAPDSISKARCGEPGYKCTKTFCFTCMGLEGEEDDLI